MKSKTLLFLLLAETLFSCHFVTSNSSANFSSDSLTQDSTNNSGNNIPEYKSLDSLEGLHENDTAYYTTADGKSYLITLEKDEDTEVHDSLSMMSRAPASPGSTPCQGDDFDGSDRKKSKTSVSTASVQVFEGLNELLNDGGLKSDDEMGSQYNPEISSAENSARVPEERRNIHFNQTWIYAFAREGDEDYHVIIGSTDDKKTARFFNTEVSGLPVVHSGSTYTKLNKVRNDFKNHFRINSCRTGYFRILDHPVPVSITGSLFFDKHHYDGHGTMGTEGARPDSYWEIHPITNIKFL
jgi:hypothetical protein